MSQRRSKRFLITQSLISSWQWGLKLENGYEDFLKTLRREPIQQNKAMLEVFALKMSSSRSRRRRD